MNYNWHAAGLHCAPLLYFLYPLAQVWLEHSGLLLQRWDQDSVVSIVTWLEHSGLLLQRWDQDSVVSIVTCYRLEDLGIVSWWGWDFLHVSRPALGPNQPPIHWYWVSCLGVKQLGSIEEEIQYRITLGNKAYYANQFFFKSRLDCKKSKLQLYCSIIRPTVTYGCETWVLE
jgi:hypothetical protein